MKVWTLMVMMEDEVTVDVFATKEAAEAAMTERMADMVDPDRLDGPIAIEEVKELFAENGWAFEIEEKEVK